MNMQRTEFTAKIEAMAKNHFPLGHVRVAGSGSSVCVSFGLIGDSKDNINGIRQNDILRSSFWLHGSVDSDGVMVDKMSMEKSLNHLKIKPLEGSRNVMDSLKVPYRKVTGDTDKILGAIEKVLVKLKKAVNDNKADLYNVESIPAKYLELS